MSLPAHSAFAEGVTIDNSTSWPNTAGEVDLSNLKIDQIKTVYTEESGGDLTIINASLQDAANTLSVSGDFSITSNKADQIKTINVGEQQSEYGGSICISADGNITVIHQASPSAAAQRIYSAVFVGNNHLRMDAGEAIKILSNNATALWVGNRNADDTPTESAVLKGTDITLIGTTGLHAQNQATVTLNADRSITITSTKKVNDEGNFNYSKGAVYAINNSTTSLTADSGTITINAVDRGVYAGTVNDDPGYEHTRIEGPLAATVNIKAANVIVKITDTTDGTALEAAGGQININSTESTTVTGDVLATAPVKSKYENQTTQASDPGTIIITSASNSVTGAVTSEGGTISLLCSYTNSVTGALTATDGGTIALSGTDGTTSSNSVSGALSSTGSGSSISLLGTTNTLQSTLTASDGASITISGSENTLQDRLNADSGTINVYSSESLEVWGDISATDGGSVTLSSSATTLNSNVVALNKGTVEINLGSGFWAGSSALTDSSRSSASEEGSIKLSMNEGSLWNVTGNSAISSLTSRGGTDWNTLPKVDFGSSTDSLSIGSLSGSTHFVMTLDPENRQNSDMLFIGQANNGSEYLVELTKVLDPATFETDGYTGLRFATVGGNNTANFRVLASDTGWFDTEYEVTTDAYDKGSSENSVYQDGDNRPGTESIENLMGEEATNYYLAGVSNREVSNAAEVVFGTMRGAYWSAVELDRLVNRMGDARYQNGDSGTWVRLFYDRIETDYGEGDFDSHSTMLQIGYDFEGRGDNYKRLLGFAVDYKKTDLDYHHVNGEGEVDRIGAMIHGTWLWDNGTYLDLVGRYGRLDNEFELYTSSGQKIKGDYDNNVWRASVEFGRKIGDERWFIEPNAQLQYAFIDGDSFSTNQGTRVEQKDIHSLIGRAGYRAGYIFGDERKSTVYFKGDVLREWLGDIKMRVEDSTTAVGGESQKLQSKSTWVEVGGGFQAHVNDNSYGFFDVEYHFGDDLDSAWVLNAGMKFVF